MLYEKKGTEYDSGDFARMVEEKYGFPQTITLSILGHLGEHLPSILAQERRVELHGIGVIRTKPMAAKVGRNFKADESIEIPAYQKIQLKAAGAVAEKLTELTGLHTV